MKLLRILLAVSLLFFFAQGQSAPLDKANPLTPARGQPPPQIEKLNSFKQAFQKEKSAEIENRCKEIFASVQTSLDPKAYEEVLRSKDLGQIKNYLKNGVSEEIKKFNKKYAEKINVPIEIMNVDKQIEYVHFALDQIKDLSQVPASVEQVNRQLLPNLIHSMVLFEDNESLVLFGQVFQKSRGSFGQARSNESVSGKFETQELSLLKQKVETLQNEVEARTCDSLSKAKNCKWIFSLSVVQIIMAIGLMALFFR